jgi:hypothetical protein
MLQSYIACCWRWIDLYTLRHYCWGFQGLCLTRYTNPRDQYSHKMRAVPRNTDYSKYSVASQSTTWLYLTSDRLLSAKLMPTFADRGCHVVSVAKPHGRNFNFLDQSRCYIFLNCPHEAVWTAFQTHCCSENLAEPGIEPGTPISVARNSDH